LSSPPQCESCFFCRKGEPLLCENYLGKGCNLAGGFAEYVTLSNPFLSSFTFQHSPVFRSHAKKVYTLSSALTDEEATLVEPTACAVHGMDKLAPHAGVGHDALVLGAGPTGLVLAQLLRLNGAARVVVAAHAGPKTACARALGAADEVVELDREPGNARAQWTRLREENPRGFDVVVRACWMELGS
jgi:D-arabinitol dehydrogenase (NADP+)